MPVAIPVGTSHASPVGHTQAAVAGAQLISQFVLVVNAVRQS